MVEFENPYVEAVPSIQAHFECLNCGGKLWEYSIQQQMVCEDCREVFRSTDIFAAQA